MNMRRIGTFALTATLALGASRLLGEEKKAKSELNKQMEQIDDGMKRLKRTLRKADANPESLEQVTRIETAALACKGMTPSTATTQPAANQTEFVSSYRKQMAHLIETMCKMETALIDNDNKAAQDLYKGLKDQEEAGHDKFMPADDGSDKAEKK